MVSLGVDLFGFILFGTLCAFCTLIPVSFFRFGKFLAIISSNTFSIPFFLSSPSGIHIMCRLSSFISSHRSCILLSFLFHLSFCCSDWMISTILSSRLLIHPWLFVASRLVFILTSELSIFDWFIFIVSSYLLTVSCISIYNLSNLLAFYYHLLKFPDSRWVNYVLLFFQEISPVFIGSSSFAFSF